MCCCVGRTVHKPLCFTYLLFTWTVSRYASPIFCSHELSSLQDPQYICAIMCCCGVGWTVHKPVCFTYPLFTWTLLTTRPSVYLCYYVLLWCRSNGSQAAMLHLSSVLVNSPHYKTLRVSKVWQFVLVRLPVKYSLAMLSVTQRWN